MNNQSETIRKFVSYVNNPAHLGGFWLPNIQRAFVWNETQIEKLYDSILREYPIGTLMIWKNKSNIRMRRFIEHWKDGLNLLNFYEPNNTNEKMLVLDGQQRMQSLFIGLKGSHNGKQLYIDIIGKDIKATDDKKYSFKFYKDAPGFPWVKFSELVFPDKKTKEFKQYILSSADRELTNDEDDLIDDTLEVIRRVFCTEENILYQVVDSIDRHETYSDDDIVEIFIRANSGGTKLDKSDLLFSLLVSSWDEADQKMQDLLDEINTNGFEYNMDFILKTCLVLFGKGAAYGVDKFRDGDTKKKIEDNWKAISEAIKDVRDFVIGKTFIKSGRILTSYLVLIPLIYLRYHHKASWDKATRLNEFLIRSLIVGAFGGSPDSLIDRIIKKIDDTKAFNVDDMYSVIIDSGRNLQLTKEGLLGIGYGDRRIHLLFNLWYSFNYDAAYHQNEPQIDHIFAQSVLKAVKVENPETGRMVMKYRQGDRNVLANTMLLSRGENGPGGKSDQSPENWFTDKDDAYLDLHLIPKDKNLWQIDNFEQFLKAREDLIVDKFKYLISQA